MKVKLAIVAALALSGLAVTWVVLWPNRDADSLSVAEQARDLHARLSAEAARQNDGAPHATTQAQAYEIPAPLRQDLHRFLARQMETRLGRVLSLPPAERRAALDVEIDRMERNRRIRQATRGRQTSDSSTDERITPRVLSEEERAEMKREVLDKTSPKLRAQFAEYRRLLNERRQQRGLRQLR